MSAKDRRHCAQCGHLCHREDEFHPYLFCLIKKGHPECTPWDEFVGACQQVGLDTTHWPKHPPLVRDLPFQPKEGTP